MKKYKLAANGVTRDDGANIPDAGGNRDWQEYQEWLAAGNTPDPSDIPSLSNLQVAACSAIDQAAGITRQKYITTSPGQEATYIEKARQCDAYVAAGYPDTPDPIAYSYVIAEQAARGGNTTYQQACDSILAERNQWSVLGAKIEEARRKAKIAINAATTIEGAEVAKAVGLAELAVL